MGVMQAALGRAPLTIWQGDSRELGWIAPGSVHLALTSPPYWTLKKYPRREGQLGLVEDYDAFLGELDKVWRHCFSVLVPGGRFVCVAGDVCLSRRKHGRHSVMPMHADIVVRARRIGFDNLTPIFWHKISNANYEVENGRGFLGKPYEPNAIVKNDVEFILMLRKPGGYRRPTEEQRETSRFSRQEHRAWFRQIWNSPRGESTRRHPAPFPEELAHRLVRMFSFAGGTVLDPFMGTGTALLASARCGRSRWFRHGGLIEALASACLGAGVPPWPSPEPLQRRSRTLAQEGFMARFLEHVLPKGSPRIRCFGWLASRRRNELLPCYRVING